MITAIKEKPILFSTPMIKAILECRKTQTRRVMKLQPNCKCETPDFHGEVINWVGWKYEGRTGYFCHKCGFGLHAYDEWSSHGIVCPYQVGDRLWVREGLEKHTTGTPIRYLADGCPVMKDGESADSNEWKYRYDKLPSIFMPRWASRINLEVTEVRVQRLQEMSLRDAIAEGVTQPNEVDHSTVFITNFKNLWDKLNSKRGYSWESNPWVWAISFKRI